MPLGIVAILGRTRHALRVVRGGGKIRRRRSGAKHTRASQALRHSIEIGRRVGRPDRITNAFDV
jgi:hypothetical protein